MLCQKIVWEEVPYSEVSDITVNRQDLYELFCILDLDNEWQHFCSMSIQDCNVGFVESRNQKKRECENPVLIMSDEALRPIFHYKYGCYNVYEPVWLRKNIPQEWLTRFPFIYPHTKYSLIWTIKSILEKHQGKMQLDDLCLEFMALYQWVLSEKEKRDYEGTILSTIFLEQTYKDLHVWGLKILLKKEDNRYTEASIERVEQQATKQVVPHCENGLNKILMSL